MNEEAYEEFKKTHQEYIEKKLCLSLSKEFVNYIWANTIVDSDAEELIMEFVELHRDEFEELAMEEFADGE